MPTSRPFVGHSHLQNQRLRPRPPDELEPNGQSGRREAGRNRQSGQAGEVEEPGEASQVLRGGDRIDPIDWWSRDRRRRHRQKAVVPEEPLKPPTPDDADPAVERVAGPGDLLAFAQPAEDVRPELVTAEAQIVGVVGGGIASDQLGVRRVELLDTRQADRLDSSPARSSTRMPAMTRSATSGRASAKK